jgi:hypothetical protein
LVQVHDFSPWTLPNGLFWIVKVPDSAVDIDENTLHIRLKDVPTVDAFTFPPPAQAVPGISPFQLIPATVSFDVTYTKSGKPRRIQPGSSDPLSPLNWAGKMWDATNSGTFSLSYDDGTFSASGTFDSAGNFGEMGTERNGIFLKHSEVDHEDDNDADANNAAPGALSPANSSLSQALASHIAKHAGHSVLLKGRVPVKVTN